MAAVGVVLDRVMPKGSMPTPKDKIDWKKSAVTLVPEADTLVVKLATKTPTEGAGTK
jgi:hypothetical protein